MAHPMAHSYTWSDMGEARPTPGDLHPPPVDSPLQLVDVELEFWVTYPDQREKKGRAKKRNPRRSRPPKRRLWAVVIFEKIDRVGVFSYRLRLRRVFKSGDRYFTIRVTNDPEDQSDEACVFRVLEPHFSALNPVEQHLVMVAAKRVYDAIVETWPQRECHRRQPSLLGVAAR